MHGAGLAEPTAIGTKFRERDLRQEVTFGEEGVAASRGTAWAALAVAGFAVLLMSLPAAVALGFVRGDGTVLAVLAASVATVMGGAKAVAVLGGLAARLRASLDPPATVAEIE